MKYLYCEEVSFKLPNDQENDKNTTGMKNIWKQTIKHTVNSEIKTITNKHTSYWSMTPKCFMFLNAMVHSHEGQTVYVQVNK